MWFLFQIKRFFAIFCKEFILSIKKSALKIKNFIVNFKNNHKSLKKANIKKQSLKKVPQITLENKYYDFYSLQPINTKPFYITSPLFLIISQHMDEIFKNLSYMFEELYNYKLKIGIEIEFYILNNDNNIDIVRELKKLLPNKEIIEKEKGKNQFEIKTTPYTDIIKLSNDYKNILDITNNFCRLNSLNFNINPIVFEDDCGSALQINFSLVDKENKKNLFSRTRINNNFEESELLLNSIGGLLKNINNNLLLYINNNTCLKRFDLERNKKIFNSNKYPAPTFISWGINNRTAAIRVPTPSTTDITKYMEEDKMNRRIEFRVPSSNAHIDMVLIGVITSIIEGIEDDLKPSIERTSYNILEKNNGLEVIENDYILLNDRFKINKNILYFEKHK